MYHAACLAALYNRERAQLTVTEKEKNTRESPEKIA